MPKGKWIDRKTAQHFTLVHRPQNDPLIHDSEAPAMVLNPTTLPNASKVKKLDDLASELGSDAEHIRANEGEAANHGIYFDDTEYDYMQHMRDLNTGDGSGEVVFVEAKQPAKDKSKGKQKQSLEDALRRLDIKDEERKKGQLLGEDILPSKNLQRLTYQDQQNIPDVIGGFQPDMDPRLREVLEALEDDAYVDDDDEIFQQLAEDGRELDQSELDDDIWGDEDEGWESDGTAKPTREYQDTDEAPALVAVDGSAEGGHPAEGPNDDWLEDFKKFKADEKAAAKTSKAPLAGRTGAPSVSDLQSSMMTTTTNGGRRKKRKGALTSTSSYSMSSSSLVRTEQLGLLDARFEKFAEQKYDPSFDEGDELDDFPLDDDDVASRAPSQWSTASSVTGNVRNDFDGILDDFLGNHSMRGKKHVRKGKKQSGTDELDEIRRNLGPARVGRKYGVAARAEGGGARNGGASSSNPLQGIAAFGAPAS
ncbi:Low temperature viability protein [Microdochium trichocladiopsis]|uniref:Low temperature viability protein n=1 Tax=Microdochium trichocladiopsis TaxID=1682393 RepID=A0A9P9BS00_9PEZI|nr:Low temperature viability protein [Microdochium trichocladiopsis]KAH7033476.1 Low temperature viability protein [Microdochium trichocladiopsis]